ncbi:hypothetical protein D8T58_22395 [Vibrio vulnificus]|nr:hypothetical protein D8T58_22395 [Vibrio vulnificus]
MIIFRFSSLHLQVDSVYLYRKAYEQSPNAYALKIDQRKWLKNIDQSCMPKSNLFECLSREYRERIRAFEFIVFG